MTDSKVGEMDVQQSVKLERGGDEDADESPLKKLKTQEGPQLNGSNGASDGDNIPQNGEFAEQKQGQSTFKVEEKQKLKTDHEDIEDAAPRVNIYELETAESCVHEVVIPSEIEYAPLRQCATKTPAREYAFQLDPFQKEAILCVENCQTVLVSAHTSAGKTVVAEYAIAQSLRGKQRVIYTTPIKALSNQKYREFTEEFKDVGLITGDVTINPSASCLIMTTEILRQMLFRGSEVMREVGWVIFDEIHYMRDKERGVVWEETIILLPDLVHCVFLSATIPNARQFAEWIATLHHQPCHVVYTDYRPVPLQHYLYPAGGDGLHLVFDEFGNFREDNFNSAMNTLANASEAGGGKKQNWHHKSGANRLNANNKSGAESNCFKVIKTLSERNLAPIIAFSFSKRECEVHAMQMCKLDFNSADEKELVDQVYANAVDVLSEEDRKLPQIAHILPMLRRGIGVHHSGLLPLVKETIEILFGEGLLKVLFATETFAMGLNMPARTVIFTNAHKFDGTDFRWINSGEYIQMSGRAGRRGLDDRGICVLIVDEKMAPTVCKDLIRGKPGAINSAFHLTYHMVLNLLRVEDVNPEYMMQHSFFQFQHYALVPELQSQIKALDEEIASIELEDEERVSEVMSLEAQVREATEATLKWIQNSRVLLPFAQAGRLVRIRRGEEPQADDDIGWATILSYRERINRSRQHNPARADHAAYSLEVMVRLSRDCDPNLGDALKRPSPGEPSILRIVTIVLKNITAVSSIRLALPEDIRSADGHRTVEKAFSELEKRFKPKDESGSGSAEDNFPLLDSEKDLKLNDGQFKRAQERLDGLKARLAEAGTVSLEQRADYERKEGLKSRLKAIKDEMSKAQSLLQMDELKARMRVLRKLGYCTDADVIELKGRVACEISSGDELMLAEMLFNGLFNPLTPLQINALLSCFVFEEKTESQPNMDDELSGPLQTMQELAQRIATVSKEALLEIDADKYVEGFRPSLMEVVYKWSGGASFAEVCKLTDAFEGSIIRCLRRLEELLRQMCQAARVIGNADLEAKFHEADRLIKRDIVFAASLYL